MNTSKNRLLNYIFFPGSFSTMVGMVIVLTLSAVIGYITPQLITLILSHYGKASFYNYLIIMAILLIIQYGDLLIYQLIINRYVQKLTLYIRSNCYQKWMEVYDIQRESQVKKEFPLGEVVARIMSDTEALRELVTSGSFTILIDGLFILSCLASFLQLHWQLGGYLLLIEVLALLILFYSGRALAFVFLNVRHLQGQMSKVVADLTSGVASAYYTPNSRYVSKRGGEIFDRFLQIQLRANFWDATYYSLAESLFPLFLVMLVFFIPYTEVKALAIVGVMIDLIQRSIGPIKSLASKMTNIQRAVIGFGRIDEFIKHLEEYAPQQEMSEMSAVTGLERLEVAVPFFQYPHRPQEGADFRREFCLKNIEFSGNRGELIGIVGLSGSGKSTLLNILAANIIPQQVAVRIHTQDHQIILLRGDSPEDVAFYKEQVSLVSQESHIFSGTLCFNITLDKDLPPTSIDFWDFWQYMVFQIPYLERWGITPLDIISPRTLSQGQKQLVQALRALFHKRPIILLDEVSSALDPELEEALRKLILVLQRSSLTILVTHRVETVAKAQTILVMKDGQIEAKGTHQELLKKSDTYQEFVEKGVIPTSTQEGG